MDLRYLHEFVALTDTGSYARAAARLSLSQSALSKHIAALEEELGVQLFYRKHKSIALSEFGELLYPYAKEMLDERELCFESISRGQDAPHRSLTIGAVGILRLYGIMDLITRFKQENPDIELNLHYSEFELKEKLLRGEVDVAFVREPTKLFLEDELIGAIKCVSDSLVAVLPAEHPLAGEQLLDLSLLRDEPFYLLDRQLPLSRICINTCRSAGFLPKVSASGFSGAEIVEHISRGSGVSLLAKQPFLAAFGDNKKVVAVDVKQYMRTYISLIYLRDNENQIVSDLFLKYIHTHL